jgi:hypothetical protein
MTNTSGSDNSPTSADIERIVLRSFAAACPRRRGIRPEGATMDKYPVESGGRLYMLRQMLDTLGGSHDAH